MHLLKKVKSNARAFISDDSGQSTTEYVLLLLFVVVAVKAVGGTLKDKLQGLIDKVFQKASDEI